MVPPHGGEVPVSNLIGYRFWSKPELLNPKRAERESMCMSLRSFILTGHTPRIPLIE